MRMTVAIASDHAGYRLKDKLGTVVKGMGFRVIDLGTDDRKPVDYPDVSERIGLVVRTKRAHRGVLICGSGVGASIAANKIPGVRAAVCHDIYSAHQGVEHDDMNILVLGGRVIGVELARELVQAFLTAQFSRAERHVRRLSKVEALERRCLELSNSRKTS